MEQWQGASCFECVGRGISKSRQGACLWRVKRLGELGITESSVNTVQNRTVKSACPSKSSGTQMPVRECQCAALPSPSLFGTNFLEVPGFQVMFRRNSKYNVGIRSSKLCGMYSKVISRLDISNQPYICITQFESNQEATTMLAKLMIKQYNDLSAQTSYYGFCPIYICRQRLPRRLLMEVITALPVTGGGGQRVPR